MRRTENAPLSVAVVLLIGATLALGVAVVTAAGDDVNDARKVGYGQIRFRGLGPERWAQRWRITQRELVATRARVVVLRRELRAQRRIVLRRPQVVEAVNLACVTYGYCATLWRKARCETGGTFSPGAYNADSAASGLFQFLPSTWDSTPYARLSVWSPYANALAAGWMHSAGRGGEWTCR
jgi:hypothetical protein